MQDINNMQRSDAFLFLENGEYFIGSSCGVKGVSIGEVVFSTCMTGYLESITDPSFYGQILTQSFTSIGNYGVIPEDFESDKSYLKGYIVDNLTSTPSNFRSTSVLNDFLTRQQVVGLCNINTRHLVKMLRDSGVMNGIIVTGESEAAKDIRKKLKSSEGRSEVIKMLKEYKVGDAVSKVSISRALPVSYMQNSTPFMQKSGKKKVILWDFGAKRNIERCLIKAGASVITMPYNATFNEIKMQNPQGVVLSNGPGDPAFYTNIIKEVRGLLDSGIPCLGICLGHQLMALAAGAKTYKLKYGHRGANHTVIDTKTRHLYVTSQNHGYAVALDSLPSSLFPSYINVNDKTCEGLTYEKKPCFSVQFHPEAAAGPQDSMELFNKFIDLLG